MSKQVKKTLTKIMALVMVVLLTTGAVSVMGMDTGEYQANDSNIYIATETETGDESAAETPDDSSDDGYYTGDDSAYGDNYADAEYGNDNEIDSDYGDTDYEDEDYYYTEEDEYDEDEEDDEYGLLVPVPGYYGIVAVTQHTVGNLTDLQQLIADDVIQDGDTILLTAAITIPAGQSLDLGFSGYNVTFLVSGSHRHFVVDGNLIMQEGITLQGNRLGNPADWLVSDPVWVAGGGVVVNNTFTMNGGSIIGNSVTANHIAGGGVYVASNGILHMMGGAITGNTARGGSNSANNNTAGGGGVFVAVNGIFNMSGSAEISQNTTFGTGSTSATGGGVNVRGEFNMTGGIIRDNWSELWAGGVVIIGDDAVFNMTTNANIAHNSGTVGGVNLRAGSTFNMYDNAIIYGNISSSAGGGVFNDGATFNMNGGAIVNNQAATNGGGIRSGGSNGSFNMFSGEIRDNIANNGGGVHLGSNGVFEMQGGTITDNIARTRGGGVDVHNATFIMNGGVISDNRANSDAVGSVNAMGSGGGVFVTDATVSSFTMTGGVIKGNIATTDGGGVATRNAFTMMGGTIENNTATQSGGGVNVQDGANFTMSGTALIYDNQANGTVGGNGGGGVSVRGTNSEFTMYAGTIRENTAFFRGGGVQVYDDSIFTMHNGMIIENEQTGTGGSHAGGGISIELGSVFTMYGGQVIGNRAQAGAGLRVDESTISNISEANQNVPTLFYGNIARGSGGGFHAHAGIVANVPTIIMTGGTIEDNQAANNGGGIQVGNANIHISGTTLIYNNMANYGGGVNLSTASATLTMTDGIIDTNTATNDGGGIRIGHADAIAAITNSEIVNNTAGEYGGGVWTIQYDNLNIADTVIFSGNTANAPHDHGEINRGSSDLIDAIYSGGGQGGNPENIDWATVSIPGAHALNNFDINYTGSPLILTVTFLPGAPSGVTNMPSNRSVEYDAAISSASGAVATPNRTGYTFSGWLQTIPAATGNVSSANVGNIVVTQNMTFVAQWQPINNNGGGDNGGGDNGGCGNNGGGTLTPPSLRKDPDSRYVYIGDHINWSLRNIHNYTGETVSDFAIVDMPSRGLNFVSGNLPVFTNGADITFDIRYTVAGSNEWRAHATGVDASQPFSFSLPQPGNIHYTNIGFFFGTVPADFALGNEIVLTFLVTDESPTNVLVNRFALRYRNVERQGQGTANVRPQPPVTGGGNGGGNWLTPPTGTPVQPPTTSEQPAQDQILFNVNDPQSQFDDEYEQDIIILGYEPKDEEDTPQQSTTDTARVNPQTGDNFSLTGIILSMLGIFASLGAILLISKKKKEAAH